MISSPSKLSFGSVLTVSVFVLSLQMSILQAAVQEVNIPQKNLGDLLRPSEINSISDTLSGFYREDVGSFFGINNPNPNASLDVTGNIESTGNISAGGNVCGVSGGVNKCLGESDYWGLRLNQTESQDDLLFDFGASGSETRILLGEREDVGSSGVGGAKGLLHIYKTPHNLVPLVISRGIDSWSIPNTNNQIVMGGTNAYWGIQADDEFAINRNNTDYFYMGNTGNVGIGTTTPESSLHVYKEITSNASFISGTPVGIKYEYSVAPDTNITGSTLLMGQSSTFTIPSTTTATDLSGLSVKGPRLDVKYEASAPADHISGQQVRAIANGKVQTVLGVSSKARVIGGGEVIEDVFGGSLSTIIRNVNANLNTGIIGTSNSYTSGASESTSIINAYGVYGKAISSGFNGGTVNITNAYGVYSEMLEDSRTGTPLPTWGTNNVTNSYGFYYDAPPATNPHIVTNEYGLYLEPTTLGINQWSIYSAGGDSYFSDNVGIGISTPAYKLDVNGDINFSGDLYKNGVLFTSGGASSINDLTDGGADTNSVYLGTGAGNIGTETANRGNVGVGVYALDGVTSGYYNTALGYASLDVNTSGYGNVANGFYSMRLNDDGYYNVVNGYYAMEQKVSGIANVASGAYALRLGSSGNHNVATGYQSLYRTTGNNNAGYGNYTLYNNIGGGGNVASGYAALYSNQTGSYNVGSGYAALYSNQTGSYNVGYGGNALRSTTGIGNTGLGYYSGYTTTGDYNTFIGYSAGSTVTDGDRNIVIGYGAQVPVVGGSDQMSIGNVIYKTGSGNVGIGTSTPSELLEVGGNVLVDGDIMRTAPDNGYLVGSYNNIGSNSVNSNPIYTIGSAYKPAATTLGNMYGIGYTNANNASFVTGGTGWGLYVAADGDARNFISGNGSSYFNAGNVGIGTGTPSARLDVNGQIAGGFGAATTGGVTDWNDASNTKSGNGYTLLTATASNGPTAAGGVYYHPFNFEYNTKNGSGNTTQLAIPYSNTTAIDRGLYMRGRYSGTWTSWVKVISENTAGNVGIGTNAPSEKLEVNGNVQATAFLYASDRRLKQNIKPMTSPLEKVQQLQGVEFEWKHNNEKTLGLIAQDVELVFPELVRSAPSEEGLKSVQYGNLVAPLIEAIKEQQVQIDTLKAEIELLKR